jgi:two-component system KDP operon response regulator KdpE
MTPGAPPGAGLATRGARILVVDDDRQILRVIRSNLIAHGYSVLEAESGEAALEAYARQHPDLIILDPGLPGIDGLTVIERIRAQSQLPIVILSARGDEPDKVRALDLGADDYVTKPFGLSELLARVRVALRHAAHPEQGTAAVIRGSDFEVDLDRSPSLGRGWIKLTRP